MINGTSANDTLLGTGGNDTIYGQGGDDLLKGLKGDDVLAGQEGNDVLLGGAGDDYLVGGSGHNVLNGGAGIDWADFQGATSGVTVDLASKQAQTVYGDVQDAFISIERLYGSANGDHFTGNKADNLFNGAAGDDTLVGGRGNDTLIGGDGDDALDGGVGIDNLQGGAGNDHYLVRGDVGPITEGWDQGVDTVYSTGSFHLGANLENLQLEGHKNLDGWGNAQANTIVGNDGDNHLFFGSNDNLFGGQGDDTFVMTSMSGGSALIMDYTASGRDAFDFSLVDADPTRAGHQDFVQIGEHDAFTAPGQYRVDAAPGPDGAVEVYYTFHQGGGAPDTVVILQENWHGSFHL